MPNISKRAFIFDEWKNLAESNPEAFEFTRRQMIDSMIADSKDAERLKRLQWRIDVERQRSSSPLSACVRISNMMFDSVYGECGLADALQGNCHRTDSKPAQVVSLSRVRGERKK